MTRLILRTLAAILVVVFITATAQEASDDTVLRPDLQPSTDLAPEEVVRIQLEALANNDDPYPDAGIELTFRFASPGNKQVTGPLERFIPLVKNPTYRDMIDHVAADYGRMRVNGDLAQQVVTLTTPDGRRVEYTFTLTRQRGGEFDGMWMTSGVAPTRQSSPTDVV
ncbi:MAG: DUF4864 domain-containing protein [Trueperaceae bacterium]|nr:DUF4864 domain-containing protein [Trueperaceae bacterium]